MCIYVCNHRCASVCASVCMIVLGDSCYRWREGSLNVPMALCVCLYVAVCLFLYAVVCVWAPMSLWKKGVSTEGMLLLSCCFSHWSE